MIYAVVDAGLFISYLYMFPALEVAGYFHLAPAGDVEQMLASD